MRVGHRRRGTRGGSRRAHDAELAESDRRIAAGEDALAVWREIPARDPQRWARDKHKVGLTLDQITRRDER
jgi:hypothetical protein